MNNKKRILVVDDETHLVDMVRIKLEASNYEVLTAYDGEEAIEKVEGRPDLILLDIQMPKLNGFDVAQRLRLNPETESIPIIIFTIRSEPDAMERALEAGACDYIVKPFNLIVLLDKVKKALSKELLSK